jgi:hypothetical protein
MDDKKLTDMNEKQLKEFVKDMIKPEHVFLMEHSRSYREGFDAIEHKNPYEFPYELSTERLKISMKNPFTEDDGRMLKRINSMFDKCDWELWTKGYWHGHES